MKILLADDHILFREGVRLVLEQAVAPDTIIAEVGDFPEALARLKADPDFEVGLVDLDMPGMEGVAGLEAMKQVAPAFHLIVVSASESEADVRRVLAAGASGFIGKSSPGVAMVDGICRVLAGETVISPWMDLSPATDIWNGALTPRQRDVLVKLRQGKSNKEIARDLDLAEITVKLHVTAILRALGVENRTQAAIVASRAGG